MGVHPSAIVDPRARLGPDVSVGPGAVVGPDVVVGARTRIGPHACLEGPLQLGADCQVGNGALLGLAAQIRDPESDGGGLQIGARCVIREYAQVHRSMKPDGTTRIGDGAYLMVGAHVAHDCDLGRNVTICNYTCLAGHVVMEDRVFVSASCLIHQFCRVGALSMIGGASSVPGDVPPYALVIGSRPAMLKGLNRVGLKRAGIAREARLELRAFYRRLFRSDETISARLDGMVGETREGRHLLDFLRSNGRPIVGFGNTSAC